MGFSYGWNTKLGYGVYSYDRTPGKTCPGESALCGLLCYAKRGPISWGAARRRHIENDGAEVPAVPAGARMVRIHSSGDFDSVAYIQNWTERILERPRTRFWAYTRSWVVPELMPELEQLRTCANMQLFASWDASMIDPPAGWRVAYMQNEPIKGVAHCPEQAGLKNSCADCGFCFLGFRGDLRFSLH